jgi:hypothetical protein
MAAPSLSGPFSLTRNGIDKAVTQTFAGVYALGYTSGDTYYIQRVGRSDDHVNRRLHDYEGQYNQFKATYCSGSFAAFNAECELWHDFGGTNNPLHPARPANKDWKCPRCKTFDKD